HLFFPQLSIDQEKFLVHQTYSRPEAWLSWHRSRPVDQPFRSLTHILWLALRGIVVVLTGLFSPRPRNEPEGEGVKQKQKKGSATAIAACVALAGFTGFVCTPLHADVGENATDTPDAQLPMSKAVLAPAFHDHYELGAMARRGLITLSGPGSAQNFFLDMPLTKIISSSIIDLRYK